MHKHEGEGVFKPLEDDDPKAVAGYRLSAKLGSGGMGKVYLSYTPGGRPVAIKVIRPELSEDAEFRRRFRQEVQSAQRVQGLYTAPVIDSDADGHNPWLATAYVPGPALSAAVVEHGKLPVETVLLLVAGIAEALHVIHGAGIVHRDLKPSNVLLAADGPRVIDFGIARAADATSLTGSGVTIGTPSFMAPEQAAGRPCTPATDVFALGQVAAYAAIGKPAFGEGTSHGVLYRIVHEEPDLTGLPEALRELVTRCLAKDPEARPSVMEVIALCQAANAETVLRRPEDWLPTAVAADITQRAAAPAPAQTPPPEPQAAAPQPPAAPPAPVQQPAQPPVPASAPQDAVPAPPLPTAGLPAAAPTPPQGTAPATHPPTAPATQAQGPATPPPGFGPSPYDTAALQQPAPVTQGGTPPGGTAPLQQSAVSYGHSPAAGAQASRPPRKSRTLLAVTIAALVFGAGGAAGSYALLKDDGSKGKQEQQADDGRNEPAQDPGSQDPGSQDPAVQEPSGEASPGESPEGGGKAVPDPQPVDYKDIEVPFGYELYFSDDQLKPQNLDEDKSDFAYAGSDSDRGFEVGEYTGNKLILLNNAQEGTLQTCRDETRYADRIGFDRITKGSRICVRSSSGHIALVTYKGRSPQSDPSDYVTIDVTLWRNALDAQPTD
ncbi:serine/threonine protein kinase [Streptomyces indicus]|uniref:Serine/threonine protein kinase n=1 Tax=Streptomyces indicus TaxID=417292 RepID=A0A1G8V045_9ACTN|nr:serine/threonine protein kinase [Streptomyces indicus]SDJ59224.1 Serine/threonine protein kinase [Streptomyces indicus]